MMFESRTIKAPLLDGGASSTTTKKVTKKVTKKATKAPGATKTIVTSAAASWTVGLWGAATFAVTILY